MKIIMNIINKYITTLKFFCKQDLRNIWPVALWTTYLLIPPLSHKLRQKRCKFYVYNKPIEAKVAHVGTIKETIIEEGYTVENLPKGDIIDIGANVGISYLLFQNIFEGEYNFYAIEPDSNNVDLLKKNFPSLAIFNVAISNISGQVNFFSSETGITSKIVEGKGETKSISLNDFVLSNNLSPTLIKIDVEGAELQVLEGGKEIFAKHKPVVFIEVHEKEFISEIRTFFEEIGYTTFEDRGNNIFMYR